MVINTEPGAVMQNVVHLERKFSSKTETFIVNQINTLSSFKPYVLTLVSTKNIKCSADILTPRDISFFSRSARFLSSRSKKDLLKIFGSLDCSLIHSHYLVDALFFHGMTKHIKVPKVCSVYGYDVSSFPRQFGKMPMYLLKTIFSEYDLFLAMTEDMKKDLIEIGCPEDKIKVHYYGTDIKKFINEGRVFQQPDKIKILTVASLAEKKGQKYIIDALHRIRTDYGFSNFQYDIVGNGPHKYELEERIEKYGLHKHVFLHGHIDYNNQRLYRFYEDADIFTLPSITAASFDKEGIPGTIVEAMAGRLPIISTFHAGIPYVIENGKEGLLVREKDVEGLAVSLYKLMKDPELRARLGTAAQARAIKELDLKIGTGNLEKIYTSLISG